MDDADHVSRAQNLGIIQQPSNDERRDVKLAEPLHSRWINGIYKDSIHFPEGVIRQGDPVHYRGSGADIRINLVRLAKRTVNPQAVLQF